MPDPDPIPIEPDPDDGVRAVLIGLGLWVLGGVGALLARDALAERGADWLIWTCAVGFGLGLVGLAFVRRRAAVYRQARSRAADGTVTG